MNSSKTSKDPVEAQGTQSQAGPRPTRDHFGIPARPLQVHLNESGFMLIQILIGVGIFGIVMAGIMNYLSHATQTEKSVRVISEFNRLVTLSQMALDDVRICTLNFQGIPFTTDPAGTEVKIHFYDNAGTQLELITEAGKVHGNDFTMDSVRLVSKTQTTDTRHIASLVFHATKKGKFFGSSSLVQTMPVLVTVDDTTGEIKSCYGNYVTGGIQDVDQKICHLITDGQMYYDPVAKKCKNRYVQMCFPGGSDTATCGEGSTELYAPNPCRVDNIHDPKQWEETIQREYADGSTRPGYWPKGYKCAEIAPLSVKCTLAEDVTEVAPGKICNACCKVDLMVVAPPEY